MSTNLTAMLTPCGIIANPVTRDGKSIPQFAGQSPAPFTEDSCFSSFAISAAGTGLL